MAARVAAPSRPSQLTKRCEHSGETEKPSGTGKNGVEGFGERGPGRGRGRGYSTRSTAGGTHFPVNIGSSGQYNLSGLLNTPSPVGSQLDSRSAPGLAA